MSKISRSYHCFFVTTLITLVFCFVSYLSDKTLEINIHDTYFVIHHSHLFILSSLASSFIGLIYLFVVKLKVKLSNALVKFHSFSSIAVVMTYNLALLYFTISPTTFYDAFLESNSIIVISLIFITLQFVFSLNLIIGTVKHGIQRATGQ